MGVIANEFLTELTDEMYEKMLNFAFVRLRDLHCAYDAVQETFLAAQQNIKKLMRSENPQGWLMKALKYKVMHEQAARARFFMHLPINESISSSSRLHDNEFGYGIREILEKKEYEVLHLIYVQGYSMKEAAVKLEITYDACKKRIQSAKRKLAQEIE